MTSIVAEAELLAAGCAWSAARADVRTLEQQLRESARRYTDLVTQGLTQEAACEAHVTDWFVGALEEARAHAEACYEAWREWHRAARSETGGVA